MRISLISLSLSLSLFLSLSLSSSGPKKSGHHSLVLRPLPDSNTQIVYSEQLIMVHRVKLFDPSQWIQGFHGFHDVCSCQSTPLMPMRSTEISDEKGQKQPQTPRHIDLSIPSSASWRLQKATGQLPTQPHNRDRGAVGHQDDCGGGSNRQGHVRYQYAMV